MARRFFDAGGGMRGARDDGARGWPAAAGRVEPPRSRRRWAAQVEQFAAGKLLRARYAPSPPSERTSAPTALGDRVAGGRVHGRWPGLAQDDLHEGRDLPVTTDFRAVFAGVAADHLGMRERAGLFPGWSGAHVRLSKAG